MKNLSPLSHFLIDLAQKADQIMLHYYSPLGTASTLKNDLSLVTKADTEINQMVIDRVRSSYPDYEILAEEISTNTSNSKKLFVVDPLDGTQMFAIGATMFCFAAAIVHGGHSIAGVISNPLAKRTLVAELGLGTYLAESGERLQVSSKDWKTRTIINCGWKHDSISAQVHAAGGRCPEVYSGCESASLVATGAFDATFCTSVHPHDLAASKIIVEEAGGKVTDYNGQEQRYDGTINGGILSNGRIHDELVRMIREAGIVPD